MFLKRIIDDSGVTLKTCGIIYDRHIFIVHAIGLFFALFFLIEGLVASLIFFSTPMISIGKNKTKSTHYKPGERVWPTGEVVSLCEQSFQL